MARKFQLITKAIYQTIWPQACSTKCNSRKIAEIWTLNKWWKCLKCSSKCKPWLNNLKIARTRNKWVYTQIPWKICMFQIRKITRPRREQVLEINIILLCPWIILVKATMEEALQLVPNQKELSKKWLTFRSGTIILNLRFQQEIYSLQAGRAQLSPQNSNHNSAKTRITLSFLTSSGRSMGTVLRVVTMIERQRTEQM